MFEGSSTTLDLDEFPPSFAGAETDAAGLRTRTFNILSFGGEIMTRLIDQEQQDKRFLALTYSTYNVSANAIQEKVDVLTFQDPEVDGAHVIPDGIFQAPAVCHKGGNKGKMACCSFPPQLTPNNSCVMTITGYRIS